MLILLFPYCLPWKKMIHKIFLFHTVFSFLKHSGGNLEKETRGKWNRKLKPVSSGSLFLLRGFFWWRQELSLNKKISRGSHEREPVGRGGKWQCCLKNHPLSLSLFLSLHCFLLFTSFSLMVSLCRLQPGVCVRERVCVGLHPGGPTDSKDCGFCPPFDYFMNYASRTSLFVCHCVYLSVCGFVDVSQRDCGVQWQWLIPLHPFLFLHTPSHK